MVETITVDSEKVARKLVNYVETKASGELGLRENDSLKTIDITDGGHKYTIRTWEVISSDLVRSLSSVDMIVGIDEHGYEFKEDVIDMTVGEIEGETGIFSSIYAYKIMKSNTTRRHPRDGVEVRVRVKFE